MKRLSRLFLLTSLFTFLLHPSARCGTYLEFQEAAQLRQRELTSEGISYMIGGSVGVLFSLIETLRTKDIVPQLGYGIIQSLSLTAIAHGAQLYWNGDDLTRAASFLESAEKLSSDSFKSKDLDRLADRLLQKSLLARKRTRTTRGILELVSAGTIATTFLVSTPENLSTVLSLGFIGTGSLIAGVIDLTVADESTRVSDFEFTLSPTLEPGGDPGTQLGAQLAVRLRF